MSQIILMAETGSDIPADLAKKEGIELVPMHVSFGDTTKDDGSFPPSDVASFYKEAGILPKTSGSVPEDFTVAFDRIHAAYPDAQILYLAYSAVTTCSYQSAQIASEGRDYIKSLDTKQVSAGQYVVVVTMAKLLQEHPEWTIDDALAGYLKATKKQRGNMKKIVPRLITDHITERNLDNEELWLIQTPGLSEEIIKIAEQTAYDAGIKKVTWVPTGGVITCHGGPGAFGVVGLSKQRSDRG